ncbi:MAG: holo-ACP synthase [Hellea sp.]|nr:holo-ACP synthase [Hellea sp.]
MILGIGTDICDIRRIEESIEKHGERFLDKIYTPRERNYCDPKSGPATYYAKRWAAKEAVAKALAGARTKSLSWQDVEVSNDPSGRPSIVLHRGALKRMNSIMPSGFSGNIHLSLTDDYPYAQAFAVFEAVKLHSP